MRTLFLTLITCLFVLPAHAKYSGGTGELNDPYQIATAEDLMLLGDSPEDYDKHFILTADIDLDPNLPGRKVFDKAVIAPASSIIERPYVEGTPFTGVLDGKGHKVSHMTIQGKDYLGLFGLIEEGAEIRNLGVMDVNVTGSGKIVGGLVGRNGYGAVTRCYSTGSVTGIDSVGGLVGYSEGRRAVTHCSWDTQTSGQTWSHGGTGKTTAEMQMAGTFSEAGWDFVGETANGIDDIWWIDEGKDYPRLSWEAHSN